MSLNQSYSKSTAILIFAHTEEKESTIKSITNNKKRNVLLWREMNSLVLKTIKQTKLPFYIFNEDNQEGTTFGERLTRATEAVFSIGYEKVIIIGNDCVGLKAAHLKQTTLRLQTVDTVLGRDYNGGVYLIGLSRTSFSANLFKSIPWQTKEVFTKLKRLFNSESIAYLPQLNDCNTIIDFKKSVYKLSYFSKIKGVLLSFIFFIKIQKAPIFLLFSNKHDFLNYNKGSPVFN